MPLPVQDSHRPPAVLNEKMPGAVAHVPRQRRFGEQAPYRVVGLEIGDGVAPGALADGALVEQDDGIDLLEALYPLEAADGALAVVENPGEGRIERVVHQRALARAGDPRDRHQTPQGNVEVHFFEIILLRAQQGEVGEAAVIPALDLPRADLALAAQELRRRRTLAPVEFFSGTGENHLAPALARAGAQVHDVVRLVDDVAVVLDHEQRVSPIDQVLQDAHEARVVPGVQTDGRLVQYVERAREMRAQLVRQVDPLVLAPAQGPRLPVEREVFETHLVEEIEALAHLLQDVARARALIRRERRRLEVFPELADRHGAYIGDCAVAQLDPERLGAQARAVARSAFLQALVAPDQHPHPDLVFPSLQPLEEPVHAQKRPRPLEDQLLLVFRHLLPGGVDVESLVPRGVLELFAEIAAVARPRPGLHRPLGERLPGFGDDERLIEAERVPEPPALLTGPVGVVEAECVRHGFLEGVPAALEPLAEAKPRPVDELNLGDAAAFPKRRLQRFAQSRAVSGGELEAIHHHPDRAMVPHGGPLFFRLFLRRTAPPLRLGRRFSLFFQPLEKRRADVHYLLIHHHADVALRHEGLEFPLHILRVHLSHGKKDEPSRTLMGAQQERHRAVDRGGRDLAPAIGAMDLPGLGEEQPQVVVNLRSPCPPWSANGSPGCIARWRWRG